MPVNPFQWNVENKRGYGSTLVVQSKSSDGEKKVQEESDHREIPDSSRYNQEC